MRRDVETMCEALALGIFVGLGLVFLLMVGSGVAGW